MKVELKSVDGPGTDCPNCGSSWPVYDQQRYSYCGYCGDAHALESGYVERLVARIIHEILALEAANPGSEGNEDGRKNRARRNLARARPMVATWSGEGMADAAKGGNRKSEIPKSRDRSPGPPI